MPADGPRTPQDWIGHAEQLHADALAVLDSVEGTTLPAAAAAALLQHARVLLAAAGAAAAIAQATDQIGHR